MIRLPQAIVAVMASTSAAGVAGGVVGAAIGRFAPSFVLWLASPGGVFGAGAIDPTEFAFGLGTVCGLFLGAGTGLFLVVVLTLRDAWLALAGVKAEARERDAVLD